MEGQKFIANKIESLFLKVDEGIQKIDKANSDTEKILQGQLVNIFGSKLPTNWKVVPLGKVCKTTSGGTPNRAIKEYYGGSIPWLKSGELNDNKNITESKELITEKALQNSNAKILEPGTLLMAMYGATVGKLGMLKIKAATNQAVCAFLKNKSVSNDYLFWFLYFYRDSLIRSAFGGAQPNISQALIKNIAIPIPYKDGDPDIKEQEKVVERLNKIKSHISKIEHILLSQENSFEMLKPSIISYTVAGKLVTSPQPVAKKEKVNIFPIQQAIGAILKRFERGEMIVAKILYLGQTIRNVPLNISFTPQNFGPYDQAVKKALTAGLARNNNFFARKGYVYGLSQGSEKLFKYSNSNVLRTMNGFLDTMMPYFQRASSADIERLATICEIVREKKTTDENEVYRRLSEWKPGKFTLQEAQKTLSFIRAQGWDKILIQ